MRRFLSLLIGPALAGAAVIGCAVPRHSNCVTFYHRGYSHYVRGHYSYGHYTHGHYRRHHSYYGCA